MTQLEQTRDDELRGIIDEKLTALVHELEGANWSAAQVAFTIEASLEEN